MKKRVKRFEWAIGESYLRLDQISLKRSNHVYLLLSRSRYFVEELVSPCRHPGALLDDEPTPDSQLLSKRLGQLTKCTVKLLQLRGPAFRLFLAPVGASTRRGNPTRHSAEIDASVCEILECAAQNFNDLDLFRHVGEFGATLRPDFVRNMQSRRHISTATIDHGPA